MRNTQVLENQEKTVNVGGQFFQVNFGLKRREVGKNPFCNCVFDFLSITQKIVAAKPHSTSNMKMQICTQVKILPAKKRATSASS